MSIAPLHGRPAPLLFVRKTEIRWPRHSATELRSGPLGTRARRLRRKRLEAIALATLLGLMILAALIWITLMLRH
jgi:hypothetical protein